MRVIRLFLRFLFILAALISMSCSNPKKEYEPIERLQNTSEQSIRNTSDDTSKLKTCDEVISALNRFIESHPGSELSDTAKTVLQNWQSKKTFIQENINRRLDFEVIQKLQDSSEQVMQHSIDYAVRFKSCDDIINSLATYIGKHPEGDWTTSAKTALMSWKSRKATLEQELSALGNDLFNQMKERAIAEAKKVHGFSRIEEITLEKRDHNAVGANIQITDVYAIRMRGAIFGSNIFKLKVTVSGTIFPETKRVLVGERATVEE